jgi:hypothetical protein
LGEKVALLRQKSTGDFATFLTQCDFPHYDCFSSALKWFNALPLRCENGIHIAGFFVNTLTEPVPIGGGATAAILRQNASTSMYHWTQNSLAEHQLATLFFCRSALTLLSPGKIDRFDVILPVSIITEVLKKEYPIYRSRHILIRVENNYFQRHYEAFTKATEKGFWSQHYDLVTNYNHELNAFYDIHHESPVSLKIADSISGISTPVDPAVHMVNQALGKIRPLYRRYKRIRQTLTHFSKIFQRKRSNP